MIVGVTKAQINCVALVVKLRMRRARFINELDDALHLFFVRCDQSLECAAIVNQTRFGFPAHELDHLGDHMRSRAETLSVIARDARVPVAVPFPAPTVRWTERSAL